MKEKMHFTLDPYHEKYSSLLIFGPPGVGKGTLCKFLSNSGVLLHISSGDIFRGISPNSSAGKLVQEYANNGLLLPDEATIAIWEKYISGLYFTNRYYPEKQYLLLDGIPRTKHQAEILDKYIDVKGVIILEVEDKQVLLDRLQNRALLEKRADDGNAKILATRMEVYEKETSKVLDHYPPSLYFKINANQKPLEVVRDALKAIVPLIV
ncbi:MAG: nucleoside monophosphate kinase [Chlamydiales bacterium]|nr:nucleoside monophosphate kinase [Chlamydiales bacterium]